jgi:hypothetical protein
MQQASPDAAINSFGSVYAAAEQRKPRTHELLAADWVHPKHMLRQKRIAYA